MSGNLRGSDTATSRKSIALVAMASFPEVFAKVKTVFSWFPHSRTSHFF